MSTDFDDLPPAVLSPFPVETPLMVEDEGQQAPDALVCETCGKVIIREPGKRGRAPKYHPECRPSANKASGTRKKRTAKSSAPDYEEGINGILQMVSFGLTMVGEKSEPLLADGMAIAEHGPNVASALNQLAIEKPEVAAVLDRVLAVGPYGLVLGALAPLCMQIASNHGVSVPGFKSGRDYLRQFTPMESKAA